jgi:hypothetical protein
MKRNLLVVLLLVGVVSIALGQRRWNRFRPSDGPRTARDYPTHSTGTPLWTNPPPFIHDVFTFVRIEYDRGYRNWGGGWETDLPDSDLNLSWRLQQMTSMRVDPNGRILRLTDPELVQFPFIYIVEPGGMMLSDPEVAALRAYLENGGFLMFDDFWGEQEWANCEREMRRVLPDLRFEELSLDHPMYRCVFQITSKGQVPSLSHYLRHGPSMTWERPDAREVHHRVIRDKDGRFMVFAAHNTDNGDGWEREGESAEYFRDFSEKIAYPLAINLIFYVMTH